MGEGESGHPGAWRATLLIPIRSFFWLSPRLAVSSVGLKGLLVTVMLRSPGQARGGRQQGGGPWIKSLWPGWRKYTLCLWESLGGFFGKRRSFFLAVSSVGLEGLL
eukprot:869584-Pelagomonas_calceolata.AAC.1